MEADPWNPFWRFTAVPQTMRKRGRVSAYRPGPPRRNRTPMSYEIVVTPQGRGKLVRVVQRRKNGRVTLGSRLVEDGNDKEAVREAILMLVADTAIREV